MVKQIKSLNNLRLNSLILNHLKTKSSMVTLILIAITVLFPCPASPPLFFVISDSAPWGGRLPFLQHRVAAACSQPSSPTAVSELSHASPDSAHACAAWFQQAGFSGILCAGRSLKVQIPKSHR